ncbi:DUF4374 domain-containing protein [Sphingobacterium spiritivorum]|uniref:DUF4374 domain-containing protein n=1 Tax=Sphingobacterium spiritivorum ATCC 33861 TaxID=525373 RepID=D7VHN0_SPHSI|nr:DUF4374 domain-containing protein [Sphingobacterium spiritivorum]EFK59582.1 hypothetical protein HMPREF0766_10499 [Sphingobacterium spiritivorum ATCC 33861]QQT37754.1 DUF4374 domain-containing protein [Sphingobacterium spiritivorum]WQD34562.1 DUF4374 domain-containing protein [Sphingobacterium spiritivorum]SUI97550.1 Uncharacterised protein [Sphingobacterium spiritivorum]
MISTIKNSLAMLAGLSLATASMTGCSKSDGGTTEPQDSKANYAITYSTTNGYYLLPIKDLMSGTISPVGKGTDVTSIFTWSENKIQKGKYFFHLDPEGSKFGKYNFESGELVTEKVVPFTKFSYPYLGWHTWIDDNTLAFGTRNGDEFAIMNATTLEILKSGKIQTGTQIPADHSIGINSAIPQGNKILVTLTLKDLKTNTTLDNSYTATMDLNTFNNFKITGTESRSAPIGAIRNGYFHKFSDEGYTYLLSLPMKMLGGGKPHLPTAFFRIKNGETEFDKNYFFNTSKSLNGDHQLGVANLGNGKVIIANAKDAANMVKTKDDWWYAAMWEYYVVDVRSQQIIRRLDFPPLLNSTSAVVDNGVAYIAVNDPKADAIYIWSYDSKTDKLTKGAKVDGGTDDTPVLYNLK